MPDMTNNENQEPPPPRNTGLKKLRLALVYSLAGLAEAWRNEAAFRQEVALAVILIPTAICLNVSLLAKALLIGSVMLVLIVELLNSAIEWVINYLAPDRHPLAKRVKDMASAAVFISLLNVLIIWTLVIADMLKR